MASESTLASTVGEQGTPGITVSSGAATDQGHVRRGNEDSYIVDFPLFVVADGMGGHRAGEVASSRVVEEMGSRIPRGSFVDAGEVSAALYYTTRSLAELGRSEGAPGSTMTGVAFSTHLDLPCVRIFNIGDSRVYLLRDGSLKQMTVDHTEYQELCVLGFATSADPDIAMRRHVLTKALGAGFGPINAVDQVMIPAVSGDRYLLCSDGLTGEVDDELIEQVMERLSDPQEAADRLVHLALQAGGRDNVTVVVVDVCEAWPYWSTAPDMTIEADPDTIEGDTLPEEYAEELRAYARARGLGHGSEN